MQGYQTMKLKSSKMGRKGPGDLWQSFVLEVTLSSDYESGAREKVTWKGLNLEYNTSLYLCTHGTQRMNGTHTVAPRLFPLVQTRVWHIRFLEGGGKYLNMMDCDEIWGRCSWSPEGKPVDLDHHLPGIGCPLASHCQIDNTFLKYYWGLIFNSFSNNHT